MKKEKEKENRLRMVSCGRKRELSRVRSRDVDRLHDACQGYREISCSGTFLLVLQNDTTFEVDPTSLERHGISRCEQFLAFTRKYRLLFPART